MPRIPSHASACFGRVRATAARMRVNNPRGQRGQHSLRPLLTELENRRLLSLMALASFNASDGAMPYAGVILDGNGNIYGTASALGSVGAGTVFELPQGSGTITPLAEFEHSNGAEPIGGVIMDSSGNLYGTTAGGGPYQVGTIFEMANGSDTITTLANIASPAIRS